MLRLLFALLWLASCRPQRDLSQYVIEDPGSKLSARLNLVDPAQLKSGFYQLEEGRWRWVASHFSVELKTPFASGRSGAILRLRGNLPEMLFAKTGPITLSAKLNGTALPSVTFRQAGDALYEAELPPAALESESILVHFSTDKALPANASSGDGRELALIVTSIALETKK
ncbi:hypothetical protein [Bryobacter aggregatus]|uniref:hypothetical protein n=1 Tax=Bryobacter aggregatus TaxID=360054 RepID=UPI0004E1DB91|nr:hypothetical protein [Bryobacter aggregatus]